DVREANDLARRALYHGPWPVKTSGLIKLPPQGHERLSVLSTELDLEGGGTRLFKDLLKNQPQRSRLSLKFDAAMLTNQAYGCHQRALACTRTSDESVRMESLIQYPQIQGVVATIQCEVTGIKTWKGINASARSVPWYRS